MIFFAQKAFIVNDGTLLAIRKSSSDPNNPGFWEVPGGRMDEGDLVETHISREVREETGLQIKPGQVFHLWQWKIKRKGSDDPDARDTVVAVARVCQPITLELSDEGRVEEDHLGEMKWVKFSELDGVNWIPNMLPVIESFKTAFK